MADCPTQDEIESSTRKWEGGLKMTITTPLKLRRLLLSDSARQTCTWRLAGTNLRLEEFVVVRNRLNSCEAVGEAFSFEYSPVTDHWFNLRIAIPLHNE
jgi:hypothetical protein